MAHESTEIESRAKKITALVGRIAKDFRHASPKTLASDLEMAPEAWWRLTAEQAGVRTPSPETQQYVIAFFRGLALAED